MKPWRRRKQADPRKPSAEPHRRIENFTPPEGVAIGLELASFGARFGAVMLDILIAGLAILGLVLLLAMLEIPIGNAMFSLLIILVFLSGVPYYVLSELVYNGRTLGKRIVGIRVVSLNGKSLQPHQIVLRNLLKQAEFFLPLSLMFSLDTMAFSGVIIALCWVIFVLAYMMRNKRKQRLGDTVAGTIVIVKPKAVLLQDLTITAERSEFQFDQAQLDIYGRYELQTLEAILRMPGNTVAERAEQTKVAQTIARRIAHGAKLNDGNARGFLLAFYREQRLRLENRQLFGDRRDDKFHASKPKE